MPDETPRITDDRLKLLDVLASGDGQNWPDLYENSDQQWIAETMYGAQADALLASSWLADRERRLRGVVADLETRAKSEIEAAEYAETVAGEADDGMSLVSAQARRWAWRDVLAALAAGSGDGREAPAEEPKWYAGAFFEHIEKYGSPAVKEAARRAEQELTAGQSIDWRDEEMGG